MPYIFKQEDFKSVVLGHFTWYLLWMLSIKYLHALKNQHRQNEIYQTNYWS